MVLWVSPAIVTGNVCVQTTLMERIVKSAKKDSTIIRPVKSATVIRQGLSLNLLVVDLYQLASYANAKNG